MTAALSALVRALRRDAAAHGLAPAIAGDARAWRSGLFDGVAATFRIDAPADVARERWLDALAEAELPLARWCVADLVVERRDPDGATARALLVARD